MSNWSASFAGDVDEDDNLNEADPWECTECDGCGNCTGDLYYCLPCVRTLCNDCWLEVPAHGRNKSRLRFPNIAGIRHEKTPHYVLKALQPAFYSNPNDANYESLLKEDEHAAWFGVRREEDDSLPLLLQDHGRFPELMAASNADSRKMFMQSGKGPTRQLRRTPVLVSFVGETGAGKSTLIRLLIGLKMSNQNSNSVLQLPVVGSASADVATSYDVHLYPDPSTMKLQSPILYADSEGLDGGERTPLAASIRSLSITDSLEPPYVSEGSFRASFCSERELVWSDEPSRRTRNFIVSQLYSRLLFTFSDVIVFVQRNARVIESVLEKMVEWAAAALETACNQPILPYAVVVLNATDENTPSELWEAKTSTRAVLDALAEIIRKNLVFKRHAKLWAERGKAIGTLEDLLLCYFSSITVLRIPTSQSPNLLYQQAQKLYAQIANAGSVAQSRKSKLRMLLDSRQLQSYLDRAFDHYSRTLEHPFDFVQASFLNSPVPNDFGENILQFALALMNYQIQEKLPRQGPDIFEKLSPLIASCIMIDAIRHNVLGTADRIFPQYLRHLDTALQRFCDYHWRCEFMMKGVIPPHLQAHLNTVHFHHNMRAKSLIYRCNNTRYGHTSKGHQLQNGIIFNHGGYYSTFTFKSYRDVFHNAVFLQLSGILSKLGSNADEFAKQQARAHKIHAGILQAFYSNFKSAEALGLPSHNICLSCLSGNPEHVLSCGDILCSSCIEAYGRPHGRHVFVVEECPIGFQHTETIEPQYFCFKPNSAGIRLLSLEDGAIHSITQLEVLRQIEKELFDKVPIRCLFDVIGANGAASIIALALCTQNRTLDECMDEFIDIISDSFDPTHLRKMRKLPGMSRMSMTGKYHSSPLETRLKSAYGPNAVLFGPEAKGLETVLPKVMITAESADSGTVVFTNYHRGNSSSMPYEVIRPSAVEGEMKVWEVARASLAGTGYFKPFKHLATERTFSGHGDAAKDPIEILQRETERLWPKSPSTFPDAVISLSSGTGLPLTHSKYRFSKEASDRLMWKPAKVSPEESAESELHNAAWQRYIASLPLNFPSSKYIRFDVKVPHILPEGDDVSALRAFQQIVRASIRHDEVRVLAMKLLAALFYFERTGIIDEISDEEFYVYGEIHCRLPNGTPEIKQLAELLIDKKFENPAFIFRETREPEQVCSIPPRSLDEMQRSRRFRLPGLRIRLSRRMAEVEAALRITVDEAYSISGFPRILLEDE